MNFIGTFWSLVPAILAIALASISFCTYIVAGLTQQWGTTLSALTAWTFGLVAMAGVFGVMKWKSGSTNN